MKLHRPGEETQGDWVELPLRPGQQSQSDIDPGAWTRPSGYGISAGFSSGTKTSTASRGEGVSNSYKSAWFRTEFRVVQYRGLCYEVTADFKVPRVKQHPKNACPQKWLPPGYVNVPTNYHYIHKCYWLVASIGWFGGATTVHPSKTPRAPAGNCAVQEAGSNFHYDLGTAVDWSAGHPEKLASRRQPEGQLQHQLADRLRRQRPHVLPVPRGWTAALIPGPTLLRSW